VENVGPCLAICNGEGKEGISPLEVTPAPCLDVTPSCHIKGWLPRGVEEHLHERKPVRADMALYPRVVGFVHADALMTLEFKFFFQTKFKKKPPQLQYGINSKEK
jgi:hypothetical protein